MRNANYRKSGPGRFHNMSGPVAEVDTKGMPTQRTLRRSDKRDAMHGGIPQTLRRHTKRYQHVLSDHITDKNLAAIANRARGAK